MVYTYYQSEARVMTIILKEFGTKNSQKNGRVAGFLATTLIKCN